MTIYNIITQLLVNKGPRHASFQNWVIATVGKSRVWATKCATYSMMIVKCCRVIAVSVHAP